MVPPESLSRYLSNEYQCYGVSTETLHKIPHIKNHEKFIFTFLKKFIGLESITKNLSQYYYRQKPIKVSHRTFILLNIW
jgi:hypothetical protein